MRHGRLCLVSPNVSYERHLKLRHLARSLVAAFISASILNLSYVSVPNSSRFNEVVHLKEL
jgi:hypothetical protein